jgi:tol-pal system protein YbgF
MKNTVFKTLPLALMGLLAVNTTLADTWSSLGASPSPSPKSVSTKPSSSSDRSALSHSAAQILFEDIEILKQEVQKLQGIVEQQGYELNKLKLEQKERYLDLDRRITQVVSKPSTDVLVQSKGKGDRQYKAAYGLMEDQKLKDAASAFKRFLQENPKSPLVVNGYYWLGQIYYNQGRLDDARKAFTIVVNQFPNHQKTADSMYKLGVLLHRLGDLPQGKEYLRLVVKQFSESVSARLAKKYLQENYSN